MPQIAKHRVLIRLRVEYHYMVEVDGLVSTSPEGVEQDVQDKLDDGELKVDDLPEIGRTAKFKVVGVQQIEEPYSVARCPDGEIRTP